MTVEAKNERLIIDGTSWRDRWLVDAIAISVAESEVHGTLGSLHEPSSNTDTFDTDDTGIEQTTENADISKAELISSGLRLVRPNLEVDERKPDRVRLELEADEIPAIIDILGEARDAAEAGKVIPLSVSRINRAERKILEKAGPLIAA